MHGSNWVLETPACDGWSMQAQQTSAQTEAAEEAVDGYEPGTQLTLKVTHTSLTLHSKSLTLHSARTLPKDTKPYRKSSTKLVVYQITLILTLALFLTLTLFLGLIHSLPTTLTPLAVSLTLTLALTFVRTTTHALTITCIFWRLGLNDTIILQGWEFRLWNDSDSDQLIQQHYRMFYRVRYNMAVRTPSSCACTHPKQLCLSMLGWSDHSCISLSLALLPCICVLLRLFVKVSKSRHPLLWLIASLCLASVSYYPLPGLSELSRTSAASRCAQVPLTTLVCLAA